MATEFKFPDVGEGIHEGEIVRWRVKVGDEVKEDQPLVEMETAKAIVELPSPKSGTILAIRGKEGDVINVGDTLVVIGQKGETAPEGHVGEVTLETGPDGAQASPGVVGEIPTQESVALPKRSESFGFAPNKTAPVLPKIRKLAAELGVDLAAISGSGPAGQITEEDLKKAANKKLESSGPVERVPLKGIRKAIAEHMVKSKSAIPHVTHMDEADATALVKLRESKKSEAEKRGIKLTFLPFIIKYLTKTLKKHPYLNATLNEAANEIIYKKYFNIAFAVDTPEGLMLPVIKDADKKDEFEIAEEIVELAEKCRQRKIELRDIQNGTFSVTNIGSIGGIFATPIISFGQTGNLGIYRIKEKPVAVSGQILIKPMLSLTITFDHRVVDGAQAARFMNDLIALIENGN